MVLCISNHELAGKSVRIGFVFSAILLVVIRNYPIIRFVFTGGFSFTEDIKYVKNGNQKKGDGDGSTVGAGFDNFPA